MKTLLIIIATILSNQQDNNVDTLDRYVNHFQTVEQAYNYIGSIDNVDNVKQQVQSYELETVGEVQTNIDDILELANAHYYSTHEQVLSALGLLD